MAGAAWKRRSGGVMRGPGARGGGGLFAAEPRSVSPQEARRRWRAVCAAATACSLPGQWTSGGGVAATGSPAHLALRAALKEVQGVAFPLEAGDVRRMFADAAVLAINTFAVCEREETRGEAAALVAAGARWLEGVLIDQGAALARAGVARLDPGERGD